MLNQTYITARDYEAYQAEFHQHPRVSVTLEIEGTWTDVMFAVAPRTEDGLILLVCGIGGIPREFVRIPQDMRLDVQRMTRFGNGTPYKVISAGLTLDGRLNYVRIVYRPCEDVSINILAGQVDANITITGYAMQPDEAKKTSEALRKATTAAQHLHDLIIHDELPKSLFVDTDENGEVTVTQTPYRPDAVVTFTPAAIEAMAEKPKTPKSLTRAEYLEALEGQEVRSIRFEGVVGIHDGKLYRDGELIDIPLSTDILRILFNELFENEFGTSSAVAVIEREGPLTVKRDSYETWMGKIDRIILNRFGMSVHDLSDQLFKDWYEDGVTPQEAARRALRDNGLDLGG